MDQELLKFAISQGLFAALFVWLLIDTRKESNIKKNLLLNYKVMLGCGIVEDLCKKQAEIIKLLTDAILINSKQEYIKSIKHICIAIITSFTVLMLLRPQTI